MTPREYWQQVKLQLNQARLDLEKAKAECRIEDAAELVRKIKFLQPEEIDAYNRYLES